MKEAKLSVLTITQTAALTLMIVSATTVVVKFSPYSGFLDFMFKSSTTKSGFEESLLNITLLYFSVNYLMYVE
jgi:hypothetical protein